jgi:Reverse transcriptase (RNA-dependent DNA polymerase)/Group II intron, maturase-specific domain
MLRAGVMQDGSLRRGVAGTPHGGVISPMLCNVYLHRLDRAWQTREHGVLVRYADDALVLCTTGEQAEAALARLTTLLAELGLEPKAAKTQIVHLIEGGEGFDFLGFHHRLVRGRTPKSAHLTFLARWPSRKATQHARDRIRQITDRKRLLVPVEDIVKELNGFLRGCAGYFRYETPPGSLARSRTMPSGGSRCCCPRRASDPGLGLGHAPGAALTRSPGPDPPRWNRRVAQTLAGRRRRP